MSQSDTILILDFGSQYTQLIARRVRQLRVYCEIHPHSMSLAAIQELNPKAIILSGGPSSGYDEGAPGIDEGVLNLEVPILGICYGLQLLAHQLGGTVVASDEREYGRASVQKSSQGNVIGDKLFKTFEADESFEVWMSHGDKIEALPPGFEVIAQTESAPFAAIAHQSKPIAGLQFHPEVAHTVHGKQILKNFVQGICKAKATWTMDSFLKKSIKEI